MSIERNGVIMALVETTPVYAAAGKGWFLEDDRGVLIDGPYPSKAIAQTVEIYVDDEGNYLVLDEDEHGERAG